MTTEQFLPFNLTAVLEDVLQQHGRRSCDFNLASRKTEEASLRRYEAAAWLRKTVGVVWGKDLPAEPSEEEFRLGLRSGIILCHVLNKVKPGSVAKVVEGQCDSVIIPDGAALSAFQYFENVRNFLVAIEEMGLPTFEASDLGQAGKSSRIVNCVLALKSYNEWKQSGGVGLWKYNANAKPPTSAPFTRKNSELFMNSIMRSQSLGERSVDSLPGDLSFNSDIGQDLSEAGSSQSLNMLVRGLLSERKQEEIPMLVESMLSKVMEEFGRHLVNQSDSTQTTAQEAIPSSSTDSEDIKGEDEAPIQDNDRASIQDHENGEVPFENYEEDEVPIQKHEEDEASTQQGNEDEASSGKQEEVRTCMPAEMEEYYNQVCSSYTKSKERLRKHQSRVEQQQKDIQELKHTLHATKEGMKFLQMKYMDDFSKLGNHLKSLAHAASGYQKVLEENRRLYNQVQDLKGNIRVYCRVRPFLPGQPNGYSTVDGIDEGNIAITTPSKYGKEGRKLFSFNKVFGPHARQEEVFTDMQPLVRSVLDGYNVCIFAYGQTGSGKTYTMTGPNDLTEESMGVNFRALGDLFHLSEQREDTISYDIQVQMLEIYNEQVRDLLMTDGAANKRLEIRNSSQNGINVPDANIVPVKSTADVMNLMNLGQKNRAVSATAMNDRSSRSHSCLTVHVQGRDLTSGAILRGSMHLVDLAGSERVDKSEVIGDRLKEAQHINKSLAALGDVIASLAQRNAHVPYRNSKLTQLLQDSLGGQAKTLMFVHISPEPDALVETISTLKFAERVATIELGAARVNKDGSDVKELKEQVGNLKASLSKKTEQQQPSRPSTPEKAKMKYSFSLNGVTDIPYGNRQTMEDVGSTKGRVKATTKPKRKSLDPQDLIRSSPPWPAVSSSPSLLSEMDDDKDSTSGDWVDKVMVNKLVRNANQATQWKLDNRQLPEEFYQTSLPDPTKIYPEESCNKVEGNKRDDQSNESQRSLFDVGSTDDSDAATSECSEPDMLLQFQPLKGTNIPNAVAAKAKKTAPVKTYKSVVESRIPSLIPQPTRKLPGGYTPPARHSPVVRRPGIGK